jgi:hypothetical protein
MGSTGALAAVARRESTTPRIVFDCPKTGRPSTNTTPRSKGRLNCVSKSLPPITGKPFAIVSRTTTLSQRLAIAKRRGNYNGISIT